MEAALRGDRARVADLLVRLGRLHWQADRDRKAVASFTQALALATECGAAYATACALKSRG